MKYEKFIGELGKAGLSVREFAELIEIRANSVSNNSKRGEVPPHYEVIVTLLAELHRHDIPYEPILRRIQASRTEPECQAGCPHPNGRAQEQLELGR